MSSDDERAEKEAISNERWEQRVESMSAPQLPDGVYSVIYADPAWTYDFSPNVISKD